MKINNCLYGVLIALILGFSGCGGGNGELKNDARRYSDAMCRNIETMQKLKAAKPGDSVLVKKLQLERQLIDAEMAKFNLDLKKKYGEKTNTPEFWKEYRKYLNESMLDCKYLSKEDRSNFEREMN